MVIRVCCSARTASRPANGVRLASPFVGVVLAHPPPRSITAPNYALLWQRAPRGLADNGLRPPAVWARTHSSSSFAPARGEGIVQEAAPGNMCSRTPPRHAHAPFLSSSCPGSLGAETFLQSTRRPSPRASWLGWSVCERAFNGRRRICVLYCTHEERVCLRCSASQQMAASSDLHTYARLPLCGVVCVAAVAAAAASAAAAAVATSKISMASRRRSDERS